MVIQNDYIALHQSFVSPQNLYKEKHFIRYRKLKGNTVKLFGIYQNANLNTPALNLFLKALIHPKEGLEENVCYWVLFSFIGATLSMVFAIGYIDQKSGFQFLLPGLLLLLLSWPGLYNLNMGQVSFLLLPLLVGAFYANCREYKIITPVILGFIASLKLFFLLFLFYFLLQKKWKALLIFVCTFVFCFSAPLFMYSLNDYRDFFVLLNDKAFIFPLMGLPFNASTSSLIFYISTYLSLPAPAISIILMSVDVLLLILAIIYARKYLITLPRLKEEFIFAFIVIVSLLLSPLGWIYYFVFLLVPTLLVFKIYQQQGLPFSIFALYTTSLALMIAPWINVHYDVLHFKYFSGLLSLILFLVMLHRSAIIVQQNTIVKKNPSLLVYLHLMYVICIMLLLYKNFAFNEFLNPDKVDFFSMVPEAKFIPDQAVIKR